MEKIPEHGFALVTDFCRDEDDGSWGALNEAFKCVYQWRNAVAVVDAFGDQNKVESARGNLCWQRSLPIQSGKLDSRRHGRVGGFDIAFDQLVDLGQVCEDDMTISDGLSKANADDTATTAQF